MVPTFSPSTLRWANAALEANRDKEFNELRYFGAYEVISDATAWHLLEALGELDDPSMDEQALIQQRKQNLAIHDHPIASFALAYRPRYGSRI